MSTWSKFSFLCAAFGRRCLLSLALVCLVKFSLPGATAAESFSGDWVRLTEHAPFSPRDTAEGVVFAGKMWLSNGYVTGGTLVRGLWFSTDDGIKWQHLDTKSKFSPRHEVTAYVYDNSLWVVAGNSWPLMNDMWKLTRPIGWGEHAFRKCLDSGAYHVG